MADIDDFIQPTSREETLLAFAKLKRHARTVMREMRNVYAEGRRLDRTAIKLDLENSPFNTAQIESLLEEEAALHEDSTVDVVTLANLGKILVAMCKAADKYLTIHDQAQVLGISHIRLEKIIERNVRAPADSIPFFELVYRYRAEHQGRAKTPPDLPDEMPLWAMACELMGWSMINHNLDDLVGSITERFANERGPHSLKVVSHSDGAMSFEHRRPGLRILPKKKP